MSKGSRRPRPRYKGHLVHFCFQPGLCSQRLGITRNLQSREGAGGLQGPSKKGQRMFSKEKPGNSLGRIHRNVAHARELLLGYSSCGQMLTVGSVNTITVVYPTGLKQWFPPSDDLPSKTRGRLAASGDIFGCHYLGGVGGCATGI